MSTALAKEIDFAHPIGGVLPSSETSSQGSSDDLGEKSEKTAGHVKTTELTSVAAPLGVPAEEKRFWWQQTSKNYDPNAIATQPSVFDDPDTAKEYQPPANWENLHRFDPSARWTWGEEHKLIRKIDFKIMIWACIMFMALELDRSNLAQAVTDNLLKELKMNTNDYNLGNTVFKLAFLCAELPSQLVSKWIGPDRWIPAQLILWSIVASSQFWLSGRESFLICRAILGILQGGFIPDIILYLSYFYKHHELSIRLGFFWTAMSLSDVIAAFLAYGLLHLRGVHGKSGWRWLFLIEGLLTLIIGIASFILMPASPTQTASKFRGKNGWFTPREETIIVNRVIREDPEKSSMHNRQPITPKLLWKSMCDFDLWPLYLIGLVFQIPETTPSQYLTLTLKGLGFGTFKTNLLVIPSTVFHMVTMLALTYVAEIWGELTLTSAFGQIWALPFLVYIYLVDITKINKWKAFGIMSLLLSYPSAHPIQVAWNSRNSNAVRSRTVSAAMYNMFVQAGGIVASNIYRADDAPRYKRGDRALVAICLGNIGLYLFTKVYYVLRNRSRANKWNAMSEDERLNYLATTTDEGNKRLDFSVTCRQRKIKCDEAQPVCSNCRRAHRECQRPEKTVKYVIHSADPEHQKFLFESPIPQPNHLQDTEHDSSSILTAKSLISDSPKETLDHPVIAALFRHYIDFLAPWYDLNDSQNLFGTLVPQRAITNPILFKAVVAFSACHISRTSGLTRYQELAHEYHASCIRDLLAVLNDMHPETQSDYLAATCLLRSYEILNGTTRQQQHLLGAYSFASSTHISLNLPGLSQSGTWNYLREEITMALELRRPVRIGSGFAFVASGEMGDDMWANYMSYVLAKVVNFCFDDGFGGGNAGQRIESWRKLQGEVEGWGEKRPESFYPFSTGAKEGNVFPSIWLLSPWHVAGEQYFSVAEMLLALSKPSPQNPQFGMAGREESQAAIEGHALKICGLAFTNENVSARVNAFGPLAFCGRHLSQDHHREALVNMLQAFRIPTGWPVQPIIEDLRLYWASEA